MANSNSPRYPGQQFNRLDTQANAPAVQAIPDIPKPKKKRAQAQNAHAQNNAQPQAPAQAQDADAQRSFTLPLGWLFTPVGMPKRKGARKGDIAPAARAVFALGGGLLWLWGAFLTNVAMSLWFPATSNIFGKEVNIGAAIAMIFASALFLVVEIYMWKGQHSLLVWCLLLVILGADIYINCKGFMHLIDVQSFTWLNEPSAFILLVGAGTATLPEKFMSGAWE